MAPTTKNGLSSNIKRPHQQKKKARKKAPPPPGLVVSRFLSPVAAVRDVANTSFPYKPLWEELAELLANAFRGKTSKIFQNIVMARSSHEDAGAKIGTHFTVGHIEEAFCKATAGAGAHDLPTSIKIEAAAAMQLSNELHHAFILDCNLN